MSNKVQLNQRIDRLKRCSIRKLAIATIAVLGCGFSLSCHAAQQKHFEGNWTGGFWLDRNWVAVYVRFNRDNEQPAGTADIIFEKLNIPVLAMWGDKDTFLPVEETIAVFKQAMVKSGNKNYVIKVYPNYNHSLLESETGSPSTGGKRRPLLRVCGK